MTYLPGWEIVLDAAKKLSKQHTIVSSEKNSDGRLLVIFYPSSIALTDKVLQMSENVCETCGGPGEWSNNQVACEEHRKVSSNVIDARDRFRKRPSTPSGDGAA